MIRLNNKKKIYKEVSRKTLQRISLQSPDDAGSHWKGVKHSKFIEIIREWLKENSIETKDVSSVLMNKNETDMIGYLEVINDNIVKKLEEWEMVPVVGFVHSNSRKARTRFNIGAYHKKTGYGIIPFQVVHDKKHTIRNDLFASLLSDFTSIYGMVNGLPGVVKKLQNKKITTAKEEHILMEAVRKRILYQTTKLEILPSAMVREVDLEFQTQTSVIEPNALLLSLVFSKSIQRTPPLHQMERMYWFHQIIKDNGL